MTWPPAAPYWYSEPSAEVTHRITTSTTEIFHLSVALLALTAGIALVYRGYLAVFAGAIPGLNGWEVLVLYALLAAASGFLLHELAHKVAAQRLGYWAEFRFSPVGLIVLVLTSLFYFLMAAPGATVVSGMQDRTAWGRTSLAGPAVNLVEGAVFLAAAFASAAAGLATLGGILALVAFINAYFAAFNLVPFGPLDGRKVWHWSRTLWGGTFTLAASFALVLFVAQLAGWPPFL